MRASMHGIGHPANARIGQLADASGALTWYTCWQPAYAAEADPCPRERNKIMSDNTERKTEEAPSPIALGLVLGLILGTALGVAFGVALGNMAFMGIGIGCGLSIGLSIGAGLEERRKSQD